MSLLIVSSLRLTRILTASSVVSGRNPYDIRAESDASIPPGYWADYLNTPKVQNAIGVDINYTSTSSNQIYTGFDYTGDFVYPNLLEDLEALLAYDVRIAMIYGDAVRPLSSLSTPACALLHGV